MNSIAKIEFQKGRIYGLDILRAAAILFVVIEHGSYLLPENLRKISSAFVFDGVSIFFVLSGFLIGGILIKSIEKGQFTRQSLANFWIRRWFRTLPNYFLILSILCIFQYVCNANFSISSVSSYFIFSQNLFQSHPSWFFPEAWSLPIEEWFYVLVPIVLFLLITLFKIKPTIAIVASALTIIILVTAFRFYRFEHILVKDANDWDLLFRKQVSTRLDSMMYGLVGAYIQFYHYKNWIKHKRTLMFIGLFLLVQAKVMAHFLGYADCYSCVFSFSTIAVAVLFLLPFLSEWKFGSGSVYRMVTTISIISYSMYLLNLTVIQNCIINQVNWTSFLQAGYSSSLCQYVVYWVLVLLFSTLLYKYFELPITKLRDRF